jgi:hypothetical protein
MDSDELLIVTMRDKSCEFHLMEHYRKNKKSLSKYCPW